MCRPLLHTGNLRSDWLNRKTGAISLPDQGGLNLLYWVEVLPASANANNPGVNFTYRITALAQDPARNTQAAWQAV
ncbi:MAG: hypothetical protein EXR37_04245 [Limnohabitans sp.]|nr:hypothetical protein [Limnohabitans sp.]